jgi:hypothetical protein
MSRANSKTQPVAFERFWAAYPDRPDNPKAAARQVFERRVREGADPEVIVAAAGRYRAFVAGRKLDSLYIPHARTWLSQRRWEDYAEAPVETAAWAPDPGHPLAFLLEKTGEAYWRSWCEPVALDPDFPTPCLRFRTHLALDRVGRDWGAEINAHFGEAVTLVFDLVVRS